MHDSFDYFTGQEPDLINKKVIKGFQFAINNVNQIGGNISDTSNIEPSDNTYEYLSYFYINYVQPNILLLIFLVIFIIFLIYRYIMKDDLANYETKNEKMSNLHLLGG